MKLHNSTLSQLSNQLNTPIYDRKNLSHGIVHIGVGGFHRAHQACYTNKLLQLEDTKDWAICGIGLRESDRQMHKVLKDQDFLYSVIELDQNIENKVTIVGAINDFLFAPEDPHAVIEKLADPDVRIVSLTITEGGYNVDDNTGEFNQSNPDVIYDIENPKTPRTVFGFLIEAITRRVQRSIPPFTIMSCDNLPHNGDVARNALLSFANLKDPKLAEWINKHVAFPNSMVDRITPMTKPEDKQWLRDNCQVEDDWPVICEPFSQWVLEDKFCNGRPEWEKVGVQFTEDVTPYETMKIRLLNASHTAMAYLGYLVGYRTADEVMADDDFVGFIREFMDKDVTPILGKIEGIDIEEYKDVLIRRFSNQKIGDQLERLCGDGSSKIPKFLIPTINTLIQNGSPLERVALIVASWAQYLRGKDDAGEVHAINDPIAEKLQLAVDQKDDISKQFLNLTDVFGCELINSDKFIQAFEYAFVQLDSKGVKATLESLNRNT